MAAAKGQPVKDPDVRIGRLRLLLRTDGVWIAYDEALPFAHRTVRESGDRGVVERWMTKLAEREREEHEDVEV